MVVKTESAGAHISWIRRQVCIHAYFLQRLATLLHTLVNEPDRNISWEEGTDLTALLMLVEKLQQSSSQPEEKSLFTFGIWRDPKERLTHTRTHTPSLSPYLPINQGSSMFFRPRTPKLMERWSRDPLLYILHKIVFYIKLGLVPCINISTLLLCIQY